MIKRILVGLAGTTYTPVAIERAVSIAQAHAAEVTGVTVMNERRVESLAGAVLPPWEDPNKVREQRMTISRARISNSTRDFEMACQKANVTCRVVEESGDPFTQLVELARYHDLVVLGLRSIFEYDFLAGDPESLLIRLVSAGVRPLIAESDEMRDVSRVLIAYSGSMDSAKAMKRFVQMRLWPNAELKIMTFHTLDPKAHELLFAAEDYCRAHGYRVSYESQLGDPRVMLLAAAQRWPADLIVMGNSARSVLVRKVLGDTLLSTLRNTKIPLFLAQ